MRLLLLLLTMIGAICVNARDIVIISNPPGSPVAGGAAKFYNAANDSVGYAKISAGGVLQLPRLDYAAVEIIADGCAPRLISSHQLADTIEVRPHTTLQEVVVTPGNVEEFGNKTTYKIPMADMERYINLYQALNEIPHLRILSSGDAYYEGNSDIVFLINGVQASKTELQTISKEDISKIDVYRNPPARFAAQGVATVIDIILKSDIIGGNIGVNFSQAFYPVRGDNSAALYYNYKRSRFSLIYTESNRHNDKNREDELLEYDFDGVHYKKSKEGLDSPSDIDDNQITFTFQNNKSLDYLYNLQVQAGFNRYKRNFNQNVFSDSYEFTAENYLNTKYNLYRVSNYFEKYLGDKGAHGSVIACVNYQHYDTGYTSSYKEYTSADMPDAVYNYSTYKTRLDAVFGEVQYQLPYSKLGYLYVATYGFYKKGQYVDAVTPFYESIGTFGANATWFRSWENKLSAYASIGVEYTKVSTTMRSDPYDIVLPQPSAQLTWRCLPNLRVWAAYSFSMSSPDISQLSETNQWLDTKLVYHGNSLLKPSKRHSAQLSGSFDSRYFSASLHFGYSFSPDMICSQYLLTDDYMLETIVNLDTYENKFLQFEASINPLGNNKLSWWNMIIYGKLNGKNSQYSWEGHRFQWMSSLSLNLNKWTASASYQYPGQVPNGQLIRPRAQFWSISGYYRPIPDLSIGLEWAMPFGKVFKESEYTIDSAPVYYSRTSKNYDRVNCVSLLFSWNFSFGRNHNNEAPKFYKGDSDSGLLQKY